MSENAMMSPSLYYEHVFNSPIMSAFTLFSATASSSVAAIWNNDAFDYEV